MTMICFLFADSSFRVCFAMRKGEPQNEPTHPKTHKRCFEGRVIPGSGALFKKRSLDFQQLTWVWLRMGRAPFQKIDELYRITSWIIVAYVILNLPIWNYWKLPFLVVPNPANLRLPMTGPIPPRAVLYWIYVVHPCFMKNRTMLKPDVWWPLVHITATPKNICFVQSILRKILFEQVKCYQNNTILRTSGIHAYTHNYTYIISQIVCRWTHVVQSHICVPLRVLTLRTSWCTCMYSQVYIYLITDTFCIWTRVVQSHICVPLQVLKPRSSAQDMPGPWVATNLCHLTIYVFFSSYVRISIYCFFCVSMCVCVCWTYVGTFSYSLIFSKMLNLTLSILS